jgi:hypothetical protein
MSKYDRLFHRPQQFWVLQVVGSNPAAPTNKINDLHRKLDRQSSQKFQLGKPWERFERSEGRAVFQRKPLTEHESFGYEPEPEETLVHSDEVAVILVYRDGRPIKIIYPDGRVEPFTGRDIPN